MRRTVTTAAVAGALLLAACTRQTVQSDWPRPTPPSSQPAAAASPRLSGRLMAKEPPVTLQGLPAKALAGPPLVVTWQVKPKDGATTTITHTAVHYDTASHPGELATDVSPAAAGYKELTPDFAQGEYQVPRAFSVKLTPPAGQLYLRAHAIIDGEQYWTDETVVAVVSNPKMLGAGAEAMMEKKAPGSMLAGQVKTVTVTATTWAFEPSSVRVKVGDRVTLVVTSVDVWHGLMLPQFKIDEKLEPGKTVTVEFTADRAGVFPFWCNVPCGVGHPDMRGTIIVEE